MFNGKTMSLLEKSLGVASLRHEVISNNIANVNTPGFKRSEVTFEESLKKALNAQNAKLSMAVTNPDHVNGTPRWGEIEEKIVKEEHTSLRHDGNNVDLDVEMAQLAMNSINYYTSVTQLNMKFSKLRHVISGGRR